jgi:hypothetical protein
MSSGKTATEKVAGYFFKSSDAIRVVYHGYIYGKSIAGYQISVYANVKLSSVLFKQ